MSHAVVSSLRALGARRIAVATSYTDQRKQCQVVRYLRHYGLDVSQIEGLSITGVQAMGDVPPQTLIELAGKVRAQDPSAQAVLITCRGLRTREVIAPPGGAPGRVGHCQLAVRLLGRGAPRRPGPARLGLRSPF